MEVNMHLTRRERSSFQQFFKALKRKLGQKERLANKRKKKKKGGGGYFLGGVGGWGRSVGGVFTNLGGGGEI